MNIAVCNNMNRLTTQHGLMLSETGQTEKEKIIYKETFQKTTTKN